MLIESSENKKARPEDRSGPLICAVVVVYAIRHPAPVRGNAKNRNAFEERCAVMCGRLYASLRAGMAGTREALRQREVILPTLFLQPDDRAPAAVAVD